MSLYIKAEEKNSFYLPLPKKKINWIDEEAAFGASFTENSNYMFDLSKMFKINCFVSKNKVGAHFYDPWSIRVKKFRGGEISLFM